MELVIEALIGIGKLSLLAIVTMWLIPMLIERGYLWEL